MRAWLAELLRTTADHLQPPPRPVTYHVTDVDAALRAFRAQPKLTFTRR